MEELERTLGGTGRYMVWLVVSEDCRASAREVKKSELCPLFQEAGKLEN